MNPTVEFISFMLKIKFNVSEGSLCNLTSLYSCNLPMHLCLQNLKLYFHNIEVIMKGIR